MAAYNQDHRLDTGEGQKLSFHDGRPPLDRGRTMPTEHMSSVQSDAGAAGCYGGSEQEAT